MKIEIEVSRALDELADSVRVIGPVTVANHTNYVVTGLVDTHEQKRNLCWCILGFIGNIIEADMSIDSAIGNGKVATDNLQRALEKRLGVGDSLSLRQKERKRDPLLQELISHVLLLIHQRQEKLSVWLGTIQAISMPHLSPNDSGIDLIAIGSLYGAPISIIGEVKAYEKKPWDGLNNACKKFSEIVDGDYDDEIRGALKSLTKQSDISFTKEQLANNIWREQGHFGALVGHDSQYGKKGRSHIDVNFSSNQGEVLKQNADNLFFISSPFYSMRSLFDDLTSELVELSNKLSETL
ncbi:MAG: hypothetical protein HN392_09175 [Anaerolineae bacterium]|jgi:hypothetical protein|nr:hypothetical protein [Anaerolineae bacterium]MBT7190128.1 hypothetical protein [Anaerolineae bacterium]